MTKIRENKGSVIAWSCETPTMRSTIETDAASTTTSKLAST